MRLEFPSSLAHTASMRTSLLTAIIIATTPYGEADRLVTFFSREMGKMTGIAKGVRKVTSRKRGALEVFNLVKLQITNSQTLGVITEVELTSGNSSLRSDLKKIAVAYFFCDVVHKIMPEREPNNEVFSLLQESLIALENDIHTKNLKTSFIWEILELTGFITDSRPHINPQQILQEVLERDLGSVRIGKLIQ